MKGDIFFNNSSYVLQHRFKKKIIIFLDFFMECRITVITSKVSFYDLLYIFYSNSNLFHLYVILDSILRNFSSVILKGGGNGKLI